MEELENIFTIYLNETKNNVKPFSTMSWLETLDDDTLKMLCSYIDNFSKSDEDLNLIEVADIFSLVENLLQLEIEALNYIYDLDTIDKYVQYLLIFVNVESMRRKGLVDYNGNGSLIDDTTSFKITDHGKKIASLIS